MAFDSDIRLGINFIVIGGRSVVHSCTNGFGIDLFLSTSFFCATAILVYAAVCSLHMRQAICVLTG